MSASPTDGRPESGFEIACRVITDPASSDQEVMTAYMVLQAEAMHNKVHEMWEQYQLIRPAVEQMTTELSQGGLMALMPALMAGFRGK